MFKKKWLVLVMVVALIVSVIAGCSGKTQTKTQNGNAQNEQSSQNNQSQPASVGPTEISIWTWLGMVEVWGGKSYNEVLAYQKLPELTNTKITWDHETDWDTMINSGKMTDLMWYNWKPERAMDFMKKGIIIDIAPLVDKWCPNLKKLMDNEPKLKKQLVDPNGKMYYFPWITPVNKLTEGMMLRKDFLEKAGVSVPTTPEEFEAVLKAFQDKDVNGNGKKDEVFSGYPSQILKLLWAFGAADEWMLDGDTVVYGPSTDNYRKGLEFLARLYKEGLLDKDSFSSAENIDEILQKHHLNDISVGYIDNPESFANVMKQAESMGRKIEYVPVKYLEYQGKPTVIYSTVKRYAQIYGLAVSKSCDPAKYEAIAKFMDWHYSEAGQELFNWGIKGDTYVEENGVKKYTDKIMNDPNYPPGVAQSKYVNPSWVGVTDPNAMEAVWNDLQKQAVATWNDADFSKSMEPILWMNDEELAMVAAFNKDIDTLKSEYRDKFITGQLELNDKNWNDFINKMKSIGLDDATKAYQSAYDRFMSR